MIFYVIFRYFAISTDIGHCNTFAICCFFLLLIIRLCLSRQLQVRSAVMDSAALHAARICCRVSIAWNLGLHMSIHLSCQVEKCWKLGTNASRAVREAQSFHRAVARMPKASEQLGSFFMQAAAVCGVFETYPVGVLYCSDSLTELMENKVFRYVKVFDAPMPYFIGFIAKFDTHMA